MERNRPAIDFSGYPATYAIMIPTDDKDTSHTLETSERRRQIFERTIARYAAAGILIEKDEEYMALIRLWISGELTMRKAASLYDDIRKRRGNIRPAIPQLQQPEPAEDEQNVSGMTQAELIEELSRLSERL